jgi:hypothetical protein
MTTRPIARQWLPVLVARSRVSLRDMKRPVALVDQRSSSSC